MPLVVSQSAGSHRWRGAPIRHEMLRAWQLVPTQPEITITMMIMASTAPTERRKGSPFGHETAPSAFSAGLSSRRRSHSPHRGWTEGRAVSRIGDLNMS